MQVALNENHQRIGETHPQALYSNAEVALIFKLREEEEQLTYTQIARRLDMPKSTVASVLQGRRRCQVPARYITVTSRNRAHDQPSNS